MGTLVSILKGDILMTNKQKLIEYIHNLTNEDAEKIIAYLETVSSSVGVVPPVPLNIVPQEQEVVV